MRRSTLRAFGGRNALAWSLPLALVVVNLGWLVAFGSGSRVRSGELDRRTERVRREHEQTARRLAERERLWITAAETRERIATLYRERFSTESARFTDAVRELKSLAQRSGLVPQAISYPQQKLEDYGLVRRSFVFGVEGSYAQLRSFLHLVELSRTFFVIEQISVAESARGLAIRLRLSTLFESGEGPPARLAGDLAREAAPGENAEPDAPPAAPEATPPPPDIPEDDG